MRFTASFLSILASLSAIAALDPVVQTVVPYNEKREREQFQLCQKQTKIDNGKTFAAVRYGYDGEPFAVQYGQCVPTRNENGDHVGTTVFCKSATCNIFKDRACNGVATPVAIDFPTVQGNVPWDFPVVADFAELEGASASCTPNKLI